MIVEKASVVSIIPLMQIIKIVSLPDYLLVRLYQMFGGKEIKVKYRLPVHRMLPGQI
jgi:hypothetical protein